MVQKLFEGGYALDSEKFRWILQSDETRGNGDQVRVEDVNVRGRLKLMLERVSD
jgi:hypothetical protein